MSSMLRNMSDFFPEISSLSSPMFGSIWPASTFIAVLFPVPFAPSRPTTPFDGIGSLYRTKSFMPNLCTGFSVSVSGRLMMYHALNGHFLWHRLHPMHRLSFILGCGSPFSRYRHPSSFLLTGQTFTHS